jgi:hypothetical protein
MDAASQHPVLVSRAWHLGAPLWNPASGCWFGRAGIRVLFSGELASGIGQNGLDQVKKGPDRNLHHDKQLTWYASSKTRSQPRKTLRPQPTQGQKLSPAVSLSSFSSRHPILLIKKLFILLQLSIRDLHSLTQKLQILWIKRIPKHRRQQKVY